MKACNRCTEKTPGLQVISAAFLGEGNHIFFTSVVGRASVGEMVESEAHDFLQINTRQNSITDILAK